MVSSVQYSKGVLVFLICQVWFPSFASSQVTTAANSSNSPTMTMATSSVSMTTDLTTITTNVTTSTMASSSSSGSASTSSSATPMSSATTAVTTGASVTSSAAMSASTYMASTSIASTMTTDNTSMNSTSGPDNSTMEWSSNSTISCRSFSCDSNCYSMFMNMSSSPCPSNYNYCELRKSNESMYSVGCVDSCDLDSTGCANDSQISCVKECCNMTDCLNTTLQDMERTTGSTVAPTTKPAMTSMEPTSKPVTPQPNNGKKCKELTCTGADCYKNSDAPKKWCYGQDKYCELKKKTEGSAIKWMAGCTNDCTKETACTSSAQSCHQECCEASAMGDCLKLDGTMVMPSDANRAIFSPLILLVTTMMAWLVIGDQL
ncbi:putative GPI-anchored protein pfl2 [Alosa sapidissima]|uniref:putative GPI-anchored protein pfl2 n=1 Tax=Alosa sapidissima TaxID=34773 RepID=UPI001C083C90|nr:putative GPI-anchored protein pfl2 [Alosa sapidissima]XP_041964401.1 putative GPI-anchored protein pfl2 [Alosa sapidissima]